MRREMPWPPPPGWKTGPYVSLACADKDHEPCTLAVCECDCHPEAEQRAAARADQVRRERGAKGIVLLQPPAPPQPPPPRVYTLPPFFSPLLIIAGVVLGVALAIAIAVSA